MNTVIRQLARRAGDLAQAQVPDLRDIPVYNHVRDLEFAQLIVQECADIIADAVDHREPASTYVDKIKQHFGVEL
jgi:hypothetical protein